MMKSRLAPWAASAIMQGAAIYCGHEISGGASPARNQRVHSQAPLLIGDYFHESVFNSEPLSTGRSAIALRCLLADYGHPSALAADNTAYRCREGGRLGAAVRRQNR